MGDQSGYRRKHNEYVRPPAFFDLTSVQGKQIRADLVGEEYQDLSVLKGLPSGSPIALEMVPEPGNPYDQMAVSLDFKGHRVGYLRRGLAADWHDYVRAANRAGHGIFTTGSIDGSFDEGDNYLDISVLLPHWEELHSLAKAVGLIAQCEAMLQALSEEDRESLIETAWTTDDENVIRRLEHWKHLAPGLTWRTDDGPDPSDRFPDMLMIHLRTISAVRKQEGKAAIEQAREKENLTLRAEVLKLHEAGQVTKQIAGDLEVSQGKVLAILKEAGIDPSAVYNATQRGQRLARAKTALELQRAGKSRALIAEDMGCSVKTVEGLLTDARRQESAEDTRVLVSRAAYDALLGAAKDVIEAIDHRLQHDASVSGDPQLVQDFTARKAVLLTAVEAPAPTLEEACR